MFILLLHQEKDEEEEEEGNYGSVRIFYYLYLQTSYLFSSSRNLTPPYLKSFFDPIIFQCCHYGWSLWPPLVVVIVTIYMPVISLSGILLLKIGGGWYLFPNCMAATSVAATSSADDMVTMPIILGADALESDMEMKMDTGIRVEVWRRLSLILRGGGGYPLIHQH